MAPSRRGFTLIEILIVVIILGILAAIVVPQFSDASASAREASFKTNLRTLARAATMYLQKYGSLPNQDAGDAIPANLFAGAEDFPVNTPLGGYWHMGQLPGTGRWGVGIWWVAADTQNLEAAIAPVEAAIDDGNDATGAFRYSHSTQQYYWLID